MRLAAFIAALLLVLVALAPAQVMLPHRHAVSAPSLSGTSTSPPFYTNLIFWITAATLDGVVSNGALVSAGASGCRDLGPLTTNGFKATSGNEPTYQSNIVNGRAVWRFTGSNQTDKHSLQPSNTWWNLGGGNVTNFDMFMVIRPTGAHDWADTIAIHSLHPDFPGVPASTPWAEFYYKSATMLGSFMSEGPKNEPTLHSWTLGLPVIQITNVWHVLNQHSATNDWATYLNNNLQFSTNANAVAYPSSAGTAKIGAGFVNAGDPARQFIGDIAEVIMYRVVLSASERTNVYEWFTNRYGL